MRWVRIAMLRMAVAPRLPRTGAACSPRRITSALSAPRDSRLPAARLLAALAFHALKSELFAIGIFPFLAFASLLVFCPPDDAVIRGG